MVTAASGWLAACGNAAGPGPSARPGAVVERLGAVSAGSPLAPSAISTALVWSVREGTGGGTISPSGLYSAPSGSGTYTVVATETVSGLTGQASVTVVPAQSTVSHGIVIPSGHPRLWYDEARLARARTWYQAHPFTPSSSDRLGQVTRGLLANDAAQCRAAIDWAVVQTASIAMSGTSCDYCRWVGLELVLTYDWCYAHMTPAERTAYVTTTNAWMDHWRQQNWGGPQQPEGNYNWGNIRNELLWAIATYHENVAMAEVLFDDVFTRRLADNFNPAAATGVLKGGIGREGSQYGVYIEAYSTVPWTTSGLLGRDLLTESNYWREAAYHRIYSLSPAPTTGAGTGQVASMGYTFYPFSDDEVWLGGAQLGTNVGNFMTAVAMRWPTARVGQHARQWLEATGASRSPFAQSVDPGGAALPFTDLPLDYYGAGAGMLYGRNAWGPTATTFLLQLKDGPDSGHSHADWGTWQLWRNGRYLSRETVSYGEFVAGWAGNGTVEATQPAGHNSLLVDGAGSRHNQWISGRSNVTRLESRPAYAFAATDLTGTIDNPSFVHWEREFVFIRALETLVVLDRIESSSPGATKTFLAHCETTPVVTASGATCTTGSEALVLRTLVPSTPTYRSVAEGGAVGQYRIEVDTTPGTAQSYILTVLQAKASTAASLSPSVTEDGTSFTVALDPSTRITFAKGMVSSGGSITVAGASSALRGNVQDFAVTDAGPAWR